MTTSFAKTLRVNASDAERRLWRRLRHRQVEGFKFRRQVPLGPYTVDFVCHEAWLVVEVDGGQHGENVNYDKRRTEWLRERGYEVLRFWNHEVLCETEAVLEVIRRELLARARTPHPNPLPQGERGQEPAVSQDVGEPASSSPSPLKGEGWGEGEKQTPRAARGFALVTALIFLLVITLLGVSLFLGVNLQQKAAGNTLQKTRALELANSATMAAEHWLAALQSVPTLAGCSANSTTFRVCSRAPTTADQPSSWMAGATQIGFTNLNFSKGGSSVTNKHTYYAKPGVWISYLGRATMAPGDLYRIDTYAYGGDKKSLVATETIFYAGLDTHRSTAAQNLGK